MGKIVIEEQTDAGTPAANKVAVFPKAGGELFKRSDDASVDQILSEGFLTAESDLLYASAAKTFARLAKGAAGQVVTMNAGATAPEWQYQTTKVNLLSNSGFGVWSNSTLEDVGSDLCTNGSAWTGAVGATPPNNFSVVNAGEWDIINEGAEHTTALRVKVNATPVANPRLEHDVITVVIGKLYELRFWAKVVNGSFVMRLGTSSGGIQYYQVSGIEDAAWTEYVYVFEATATTLYFGFYLQHDVAGEFSYFDDASIYEVTPGCVAADTLGPEGWYKKSGLHVLRQHNDGGTLTKDGEFYSLKADSITAGDNLIWPLSATKTLAEHYQKFAGRTVTFGAWVYATTASHAFLQIVDSDTTDDDQSSDASSYHTGGSAWEWLEVTLTVSATTTEFSIAFCFDSTTTAYISQPMLVFGSSIGEGNYQPSADNLINVEANIALTDYTADAVTADATINLEAQSSGKIPKGCKAVHGWMEGQNSASDKYVDILSASGGVKGCRIYSQVNAKDVAQSFRAICDSNGDIYIDVEDGNWTNVTIQINAVEV